MACQGKRTQRSGKCGSIVRVCKYCGSVGCEQSKEGACSNQVFRNGKCLKCGKAGAMGKHV